MDQTEQEIHEFNALSYSLAEALDRWTEAQTASAKLLNEVLITTFCSGLNYYYNQCPQPQQSTLVAIMLGQITTTDGPPKDLH